MPTSNWHLIERRGRASLQNLEADWQRIYAASPLRTSYLSHEVCLAHTDHFVEHPDLLRCLVLSDGTTVRGICVLEAIERKVLKKNQRAWKVLFHWRHACQANTLCADDEARSVMLPLVISHVQKHPEGRWLLELGASPEQSPLQEHPEPPLASSHLDESASVCVLSCSQPFEEFRASLSGKFRRNLNRTRGRLHELEGANFTTVTSMEEGFAEALQAFLAVEASGWKGEKGERSAVLCDPTQVAYVHALSASLRSPTDHCVIDLLHADGRCIAGNFSVQTGSVFSVLKIGYDENYRRLSPGALLMEELMSRCCQNPTIAWLDLVSDAPWMRDWQPRYILLQTRWVNVAPRPVRPIVSGLLKLRFGLARRLGQWLRERKARA